MLFDINNGDYKFREEFDEFPDIEKHTVEYTRCTCGSTEATVVSTVSRHRNFQPIVACEHCGTLRANPYLTEETAAHYYRNVYGNVKRTDRSPQQLFREQRALSLVPFFEGVMDRFETVLDYGGGAGGKTADFLDKGKVLSLYEVENKYSQFAFENGILPHDPSKRYDLVVVSHVIEHMIDPVRQMRQIIDECCTPGGLLLVATPIIDRQRAGQWLQHFHIAHKYYFTEDALIGLMAGLGCKLVKQNNADAFLFEVGAEADGEAVERHYRAGAKRTRAAIAREERPSFRKFLNCLKFRKPQPHNQAAPRTPELSP
jgi:SAM-dependent methyltransferase